MEAGPALDTEQVIYGPVTAYGMFIVNTTIPAASQALTCESRPASGYTMAVTMGEGGAASQSFFGDANNNYVTYNGEVVSGIGLERDRHAVDRHRARQALSRAADRGRHRLGHAGQPRCRGAGRAAQLDQGALMKSVSLHATRRAEASR